MDPTTSYDELTNSTWHVPTVRAILRILRAQAAVAKALEVADNRDLYASSALNAAGATIENETGITKP